MHGGVMSAATAPVAVIDPGVPIYGFGVAALLRRGGLAVTQSDKPLAWASEPGNRALVVVTRSEEDWLLLQGLANIDGCLLVAVLVQPDVEMYRRALDDVGALGAIGWNARPEDLVKTVAAAAGGDRLLPRAIALALAHSDREPVPDWYGLDADGVYLIQALRRGDTQVTMAHHLDCSDRTIRSKLAALYRRLNVRNGAEAITKTSNWKVDKS